MWLQQQRPQDVLHTGRHVLLRYSSEAGIHAQSLSSCHVIQHSIKLGAVANALLHLQPKDETGSYKVFPRTPKKKTLGFKPPALTFLMSLKMLYPSIKASPEVTLSSPVSILNVVVLPAPLKPRRPKHSPLDTARDSRSTARRVCPLVYTWEEEISGSVPSRGLTKTHTEREKKEKTSHFFLTLLSCCRMSGLLTIDSNTGWHSRTLFLSSATSLSSGIIAESWITGNWDAPARQNINSRNH